MELKRLSRISGAAWLLDDRYEIALTYNHGRYFTICDLHTLVDKEVSVFKDGKFVDEIIKVPQEHIYFDGGGFSSQEKGLYSVKHPA